MKAFRILPVIALCMMISGSVIGQSTTETFKVSGNCGMCKTKIEKAALAAGAEKAVWDVDSKDLTITYASSSTNTAKIQKKIAEVGYDNVGFKASDKAYDKLHGCCKYDRNMTMAKASCCSEQCEMKDGKCASMEDCKAKGCCKDEAACKANGCCGGDHKMDCCKDGKCSKEGHNGKDCCKKS